MAAEEERCDGKSFKVYGSVFQVDARYEFLNALGKGSYGIVCAAKDRETGHRLAIKKVCPMAKRSVDAKHTLREVLLLQFLGKHPNIISLHNLSVNLKDDELYLMMDLMDTDLHRVIQSSQSLSDSHVKYFLHQLLRGVKYLHDNGVLHRDLKPGNLLLTKTCQLKPDGYYDTSVDMWSVGCIFAEILGRKALFPGKNFLHQLTLIFELIGTPPSDATARIKSSQAQRFLKSLGKKPKVPLRTVFPMASDDALDLLDRLLEFDPAKRLTADEALAHPYMQPIERKYKGVDPMPTARVDFSFDAKKLTKMDLQTLLLKEVERFRAGVAHAAAIDAALSDEDGVKPDECASSTPRATSTPPTTMTPTQLATSRIARPQSAQVLSSSRSVVRQSTIDSTTNASRPEMERPASANLSTSVKIGSQRWRIRVASKPPVPRQPQQQLQTGRSLSQNPPHHHVHVVAPTDARSLLFASDDVGAGTAPAVSQRSKSPDPQVTATTPIKSPSSTPASPPPPTSPAVEDESDKRRPLAEASLDTTPADPQTSVETTAMALSALEQRSRALMSKISATAVTRSTTQLGNQQDATGKRAPKKLTVPKSPKFSVMSWQKKKEMAVAARVARPNMVPPVLPIHMKR
ncbi:hypothetical protein ATCC90586_001727 [Pythium insidiosum]|nr:hypothetical protein ATCC90586_001727 [Pythium insidiosum]